MKTRLKPTTKRTVKSAVHCWAQPIGSRRWHVSLDGKRFLCGAFSGDRFKGNVQVMDTADVPVLCCPCVAALLSDGQAREE